MDRFIVKVFVALFFFVEYSLSSSAKNREAPKNMKKEEWKYLGSLTSKDRKNLDFLISYNKNGAILKSKGESDPIYLGKDCDTYSKTYGKGKWSFYLNSPGFYIGFGGEKAFRTNEDGSGIDKNWYKSIPLQKSNVEYLNDVRSFGPDFPIHRKCDLEAKAILDGMCKNPTGGHFCSCGDFVGEFPKDWDKNEISQRSFGLESYKGRFLDKNSLFAISDLRHCEQTSNTGLGGGGLVISRFNEKKKTWDYVGFESTPAAARYKASKGNDGKDYLLNSDGVNATCYGWGGTEMLFLSQKNGSVGITRDFIPASYSVCQDCYAFINSISSVSDNGEILVDFEMVEKDEKSKAECSKRNRKKFSATFKIENDKLVPFGGDIAMYKRYLLEYKKATDKK